MTSAAAKARTRVDIEQLTSLGVRFRMWQKRQGKSDFKMPSHLWDEAFAFVPLFGATRVAREINVSREELLRRMNEEHAPVIAAHRQASPRLIRRKRSSFSRSRVEWPGSAMPSPPSQPTAAAEMQTPAPPGSCEPAHPATTLAIIDNATPASDTTPLSSEEAWLEVIAADGSKLTLRVPANHLISAAALIREFRSQR